MKHMGAGRVWFATVALALFVSPAWCEVLGTAQGELDARDARTAESSFGSLVADAARAAVGAELALVQASLLRPQALAAGDLTRDALTGALLYPDEKVVLVEITGQQVRGAVERGISMLPRPSTGYLQVAGMNVTFRSQAQSGARVTQITLGKAQLAPEKKYNVAMPASLAKGGLGYYRVFNGLKPKRQGPQLGDALCDHVLATRKITPAANRFRDLTPPAQ